LPFGIAVLKPVRVKLHPMPQMLADPDAARAQRQRVVFGKCALAGQCRHDRTFEQFGQCLQLRPGLAVMHTLTGDDHRPLCRHQRLGDL
jgi:hypothetical protein